MKRWLLGLYARIFSRYPLSRLNSLLLYAALRARGYDNYDDFSESGEEYFLSKVLAPSNPAVCIDVGANVGDYTMQLLERTEAVVVSFEPLSEAFTRLRERTSGFRSRSIVENKGVGERTGRLVLHFDAAASLHASFSEEVKKVPYVRNDEQADVAVVSLDDYLESNGFESVDFIKIDTEGFESEVLRGATETIRRHRPKYIQVEFNWHQMFRHVSLNDFAERLADYDAYQLLPRGWIKRDPRAPFSNFYLYSNFVFVRR